MKKLTLLLAILSLIVGALFLSACSEPMGSETDDGLAIGPAGEIRGYVYYWDGDSYEPAAVGMQEGDDIYLTGPSSGCPTSTTSNGSGEFTFGWHPYSVLTTYNIDVTWGDYSGDASFGHNHDIWGTPTIVTIYLEEN